MHFHHRHDVEGCLDAHHDWPEPHRVMLATLDRLESRMSTVQEQIDGLAADVEQAVAALAAKPAEAPAPDLSQLSAAVEQLKIAAGVEAAPVADTPTDTPTAPPADIPAAPVEQPEAPTAATGLGDPVQV